MIEQRKLARFGQFTYRLYKASSVEEALSQVDLINKHYKKSVHIEDWGEVKDKHLTQFANMCDDLAYENLNLKVDDKFILVKEITSLKMDDDRKVVKNNRFHHVLPVSKGWSDKQLANLWIGLPEVVAKVVNKTVEQVEKERKKYIAENPNFVYPPECKRQRKNAKVVIAEKPWNQQELGIIWNYPPKQVSDLIKRTVHEISDKRREICLENPKFIIPISAKFSKVDLSNEVEIVVDDSTFVQNVKIQNVKIQKIKKGSFWERNSNLLWEHSSEEVERILGKSKHAVYQQRLKFLQKNKGFVIPKISSFRIYNYNTDKYQFTYEEENPDKVETLMEEIPVGQIVQEKQEKQEKQEEEEDEMGKIALLLNNLAVKPKKITIGNLTLEF